MLLFFIWNTKDSHSFPCKMPWTTLVPKWYLISLCIVHIFCSWIRLEIYQGYPWTALDCSAWNEWLFWSEQNFIIIFCVRNINRLIRCNRLRIQMSIFNKQINYLLELFCTYKTESVIFVHQIICIHVKLQCCGNWLHYPQKVTFIKSRLLLFKTFELNRSIRFKHSCHLQRIQKMVFKMQVVYFKQSTLQQQLFTACFHHTTMGLQWHAAQHSAYLFHSTVLRNILSPFIAHTHNRLHEPYSWIWL